MRTETVYVSSFVCLAADYNCSAGKDTHRANGRAVSSSGGSGGRAADVDEKCNI